MNERMGKRIDELLESQKLRKQDEASRAEQARVAAEAFNGKAADVLEKVVAPAMQEFAEKLIAGGCRSKVIIEDKEYLQPCATLCVAPEGVALDSPQIARIMFRSEGHLAKVRVFESFGLQRRSEADLHEAGLSLPELTREKADALLFAFAERAISV